MDCERRTEILERDGFACQICGCQFEKTYLVIHHRSYDDDKNDDNLQTYCRKCHGVHHRSKDTNMVPIRVNKSTKDLLKTKGTCGDTFDSLITRIVRQVYSPTCMNCSYSCSSNVSSGDDTVTTLTTGDGTTFSRRLYKQREGDQK